MPVPPRDVRSPSTSEYRAAPAIDVQMPSTSGTQKPSTSRAAVDDWESDDSDDLFYDVSFFFLLVYVFNILANKWY